MRNRRDHTSRADSNPSLDNGSLYAPSSELSRRDFFRTVRNGAIGATGAYALSRIPLSYGLDTVVVPKLSYNPKVDELLSDQSLQAQMLALDMRNDPSSPVDGKVGFGFDDNNVDIFMAYATQTDLTKVNSAGWQIAISKTNSDVMKANDCFLTVYEWTPATNARHSQINLANPPGYHNPQPLPDGFAWDSAFSKSYFNQEREHIVFGAQIPNSYIGPGSNGKYGIWAAEYVNDSPYAPEFPASGSFIAPNTWGSFSTQYPVPEFSSDLPLLTLALFAGLGAINLRKNKTR